MMLAFCVICSRTEFPVGLKAAQHHESQLDIDFFTTNTQKKTTCSALMDFTKNLRSLFFIHYSSSALSGNDRFPKNWLFLNLSESTLDLLHMYAHVTNYQFNYLILRILLRQNEFPSSARARPGPILVLREAPGKSGHKCARYVA